MTGSNLIVDIAKRDNKAVLQGIIDSNTEIPTDEGKVSIKWIDNALKVAFDNDDFDTAFPRQTFIHCINKTLRITQIEKTSSLVVVKVLVAVLLELVPIKQCVYCQNNLEQSKNRLQYVRTDIRTGKGGCKLGNDLKPVR